MRAVVDTSVWVSAILNPVGPPARVLEALEDGGFSLVTSEPLLAELAEVIVRPRLARRYKLSAEKSSGVLRILRAGEIVEVMGTTRICRDPDDDVVIETAINGGADVLVSRDDDLKRSPEVAAFLAERGVRVLTVQRFLEALEAERSA